MKGFLRIAGWAAAAAALILDSRCAAESAAAGITLCIRTLIPSLFPLFVVSAMLVPQLGGASIPGLAGLLGIPAGSEGIFLLGTVGGFPVGAACISQAVRSGGLRKTDAERMLGFCSSAGPAFLFGVLSGLLRPGESAALFLIQMASAIFIAACWPGKSDETYRPCPDSPSLPAAVRRSIGSMAAVCAWVILAGVLVGFGKQWLFPLLPESLGILLTGLLEITGGAFALSGLADPDVRFVLAGVFICFGGISVLLQIQALAKEAQLSMKSCITQKLLQGILGGALSIAFLRFGWLGCILPLSVLFGKKAVEISRPVVYNRAEKGGI